MRILNKFLRPIIIIPNLPIFLIFGIISGIKYNNQIKIYTRKDGSKEFYMKDELKSKLNYMYPETAKYIWGISVYIVIWISLM